MLMQARITKVLFLLIGFIVFAVPCDALSARFVSNFAESELWLVVQWESTNDVIVVNPVFDEEHPLFRIRAFETLQQQKGQIIQHRRGYVLDELWDYIPKSSVKIINSGRVQELSIPALQLKRQNTFWIYDISVILLICSLCLILFCLWNSSKSNSSSSEPGFSRETAVQAAKHNNWSLLFEILSTNAPWRSELGDLPWEQWHQQWRFASREPTDRDRQLIIKLLQQSRHDELRDTTISEEEKVLSEVLEK